MNSYDLWKLWYYKDESSSKKYNLEELLGHVACINSYSGVEETTYMKEEAAELIVELSDFLKKLCKMERSKELFGSNSVDYEAAKDEAIDVLTTILVFLRRHDMYLDEIYDKIEYKLKRAIRRFRENGDV